MNQTANCKMVSRLLFRLLPIQVLLAAVGAVNGIVSSFFASNFVGVDAMSAVGLYSPLNMLITALSLILVGGSVILCGKYIGENDQDGVRNVFSLNLLVSALTGLVFAALFLGMGLFNLTGFLTKDEAVRPLMNRYLIGQSLGVLPLLLGNSLAAFLSLENKTRRTMIASVVYIVVNLILNYLFVELLHMEALGLALASSLGMWVFLLVQAEYYASGKSHIRFSLRHLSWHDSGEIFRIGVPGALSNVYQTVRGLLVNRMLDIFVGSVAISAFATADNLLRIFWAIPTGMLAVSRMLISVSIGEEDRQTLTDVMRVMFRRFVPLQYAISAGIILCAVPLTRIFYHDPAEPVFMMTVWGFRILPLCMPLSIICMHFTCYGQASNKQVLVHLLSLLDGVVCVAGFTALLIRSMGLNSAYVANVLNGVVTTLVIIGYAWIRKKRFPRNMEELMVIDDDFGAPEDARLDLSVRDMEGVVSIAERVQAFCLSRGLDAHRAYLAGLSMEEMAGNIIDHGFTKDKKPHSVDVRVVHKNDDIILRIKDDCVPFDPHERQMLAAGEDPAKNIGIRMVFKSARDVQYQNILGLNVLTIRI
ncbi:MAG: polysaccharide biosynthesis C-terminal domain-containing protein [Oscillospiraceae bacterium]|nr:polysaccharide biosynthesis C-terminal domain-containing protein [Oscillospiraceae bacterium]